MYIFTCSEVRSLYVLQLLTPNRFSNIIVKMHICDLCIRSYKNVKCLKRHIIKDLLKTDI